MVVVAAEIAADAEVDGSGIAAVDAVASASEFGVVVTAGQLKWCAWTDFWIGIVVLLQLMKQSS